MSKKLVGSLLIATLVVSLSGAALAGKKKKGPKPYTSDTVTIQVGHPAFHSTSGTLVTITAQEFLANCALPSSNGLDAYVLEVPADYQKLQASVEATGQANPDTPAAYDLDLYMFDSACAPNGVFNAAGTDEAGVISKGTAFILLHNYTGGPVDAQIELKPY